MSRTSPITVISNEITTIEIYESYAISTITEGLALDHEHIDWFSDLFDKYYPNTKFGYIANRVNAYSINPLTYYTTAQYKNLSAFAIVCKSQRQKDMALYEKRFYNKPFNVFMEIESAISWVEETI